MCVLDDEQILRSRGRIGKCAGVEYTILNTVMLRKDSHLTMLFIVLFILQNSGFWVPQGRATMK